MGQFDINLGGVDVSRAQFSSFTGAGGVGFWPSIGYDAVKNRGDRKLPLGRVLSEDMELRSLPRRQLMSNLRDLDRNFSTAAWMVRCHLDYVATLHFRSKTGNKTFDEKLNKFYAKWCKAENCDPGARHSMFQLRRLWEARRVIDGDILLNRLSPKNMPWLRGRIQSIEGDRIQTFGGIPFSEIGIDNPMDVVNGVWVDPASFRARAYMVFKRPPNWTGLLWDRSVPARWSDLFGYFQRYDQVRGIAPLASAANSLRDLYEGFNYALLKAKVTQIFGMATTRQGSEEMLSIQGDQPYPNIPGAQAAGAAPGPIESETRYNVNVARGPFMVDLDPGDKIEVIESKQPSNEFREFTVFMMLVSLRALDIPLSFMDESHTTFAGQRMAAIQYENSVTAKREPLIALSDKHARWRFALGAIDGELELPRKWKVEDLEFEFSHKGNPWYDPLKEVSASIAAVNAGFSSQIREAKKLGLDAYELIDERSALEAYARSKNVVLATALASVAADDPNKPATAKEDVATTEEEDKAPDNEEERKPLKPKPGKNGRKAPNGKSMASIGAFDFLGTAGRALLNEPDSE